MGAKIELGGTRNPAAFDAYLRGSRPISSLVGNQADLQAAIAEFAAAIRLDPNYALALLRASLCGQRAGKGSIRLGVCAGFGGHARGLR